MDDRVLKTEDVLNIHSIFTENNWFTKIGQDEVHKNLCNLLVNLTPEQKDLVMDLSRRYLWLSLSEYTGLLLEILDKVEDEKLIKCDRIVLFPIIIPEDEGKIKSSSPLLYMFKAAYFGGPRYKNIKFQVIESYEDLIHEDFKEKDLIFLVDDYVGSGDTLFSTLEEIKKNKSAKDEIINIISLVAQKETLSELNRKGIAW